MQFTVPAVRDAVAATIPDRVLLTHGNRRYTYADVVDRSNRLASYLHSVGLGCHTSSSELAGHDVGQDLLGIYAYNGNEFRPVIERSPVGKSDCRWCHPPSVLADPPGALRLASLGSPYRIL